MAFSPGERFQQLQAYVPGKPIQETRKELGLRRIIKLASNENPLGPSPKGLAAARKSLRLLNLYPDGTHSTLCEALAQHHGVDASSLIIGSGSEEVLDILLRLSCSEPTDTVLTTQLAFVSYKLRAQVAGARVMEVPLSQGWTIDLDHILHVAQKSREVKMIVFANPNNPTATQAPWDEVKEFVSELQETCGDRVLCVIDAAYFEYGVLGPSDPVRWVKKFPNLVVTRTFSKIYGLAGLRVGFGVAHPTIAAIAKKIRYPFNVTTPALEAATAALEDKAFLKRTRQVNEQGREFLMKKLKRLGFEPVCSGTNFLFLPVQKPTGMTGEGVFQALLRRGVIIRPLSNYGLHDHIRVSIGTQAQNEIFMREVEQLLRQEKK